MQKSILHSVLITIFVLGLYGCSCSQRPDDANESRSPGLYLSDLSFIEKDSGFTEVDITVILERDITETVTVDINVEALSPAGRSAKSLLNDAIVGSESDPDVDVVQLTSEQKQIVFLVDGVDTQTIKLKIKGDVSYEYDENFLISISNASAGVNIVAGAITATIINNDPKPNASIELADSTSGVVLNEVFVSGGAESARLPLKLTLDAVSQVDAIMTINGSQESANSSDDSVAAFKVDYLIFDESGTLIEPGGKVVVPAGQTDALLSLEVVDDGTAEDIESFKILIATSADVNVLKGAELDFTINDNDTVSLTADIPVSRLTDTGLLSIYTQLSSDVDEQAALELELDVNKGRDSRVLVKIGGGRAGFDYTRLNSDGELATKLDVDGNTVPVTENDVNADGDGSIPWECVRDNVTGLVWEVKTRGASGLRSESHTLTWYDPSFKTNGGNIGEVGLNKCNNVTSEFSCNTAYYAALINAQKLCGMTGWRLPTIEELQSLVDYGVIGDTPNSNEAQRKFAYDADYFPGDIRGVHYIWTSTTSSLPSNQSSAIAVKFANPIVIESRAKNLDSINSIRLVNSSELLNKGQ